MGKPPSPWPLQVPRRKESGATAGCITAGDVAGAGDSSLASIFAFLWKVCMIVESKTMGNIWIYCCDLICVLFCSVFTKTMIAANCKFAIGR